MKKPAFTHDWKRSTLQEFSHTRSNCRGRKGETFVSRAVPPALSSSKADARPVGVARHSLLTVLSRDQFKISGESQSIS